jgi:hypothetical protein
VRLVGDARTKPIYEDEALAGLIAARPLTDVVKTVMGDRGGAPLHFVLAHVTLALDPSPIALRALSIVFALATVLVCYDLGRRLAGQVAGMVAAFVAAGSELLLLYGSFGRMYALFAFASALAANLFVRALEQRTAPSAALAALAALLLPASHPYGIVPFVIEAAVGLALWRGRPFRPALPTLAITLGVVPFLVADLRLADRFSVGLGGEAPAERRGVLGFLEEVFRGFGGGRGPAFFLLVALALAGLVLLARRSPGFAALAGGMLVAPAVIVLLLRTGDGPVPLSSRYFIFLLPVWAALVGVAVARGAQRLGPIAAMLAVLAVAALVFLAPGKAVTDPRVLAAATPEAVAATGSRLRDRIGERDVLFPYSPVYLAALPEAGAATVVSRARPELLLRELDAAEFPVRRVFVAAPRNGSWQVMEADGPFADRVAVLRALRRGVSVLEPDPYTLKALRALDAALAAS